MTDIIFSQDLSTLTFTGTGAKKTAVIEEPVFTPTLPLDTEPSTYSFRVNNDTLYECNYAVDGTNWITVSYKIDGVDGISVRINKTTNIVELSIRPELVGINVDSDYLECIEHIEPYTTDDIKYAIVRFTNNKAVKLTYNIVNDTVEIEEVS